MTGTAPKGAGPSGGSLAVADRYSKQAVDTFYEHGWWRREHLTDYLAKWAGEKPGARFISDGVRELTWGEFHDRVGALARSLVTLGVEPGDRVVCQLPNWVEFAVLYLALGRIGAVLVPIMPVYRRDEAEYVIKHSEAVLALTTGTFRRFDHLAMFRELKEACPTLRQVVVARAEPGRGELSFDDLAAPDGKSGFEGLSRVPDSDDVHLIVYTSGTESKPKGCCHTWNTFGFSVRGLGEQVFRMTVDDVVFMPSPIAHSTGLLVGVAMPTVTGSATHLLDVWDPNEGLKRMQEYGCTVSATATPFVRMALDAFEPQRHDISSMRFWLCAGAPIPSSAVIEVAEKFEGCHLVPLYGCSEVLASTSCTLDDPVEAVTSSDGRPALPGVEIRLGDKTDSTAVDGDHAQLVEPGAEGEILYRGPGCMLGYWRDPDRTAATIDAGNWYHSGDLGKAVDGGYVRVTGRIKDLVIRGGTNISPREVEEHINTHPKVQACALVGYPDERLGEKACAFVVLTDPGGELTLEELGGYLRHERHIAVHKLPERLEIIDELPMGATGKVQKFQLRAMIVSEDQARPTRPLLDSDPLVP